MELLQKSHKKSWIKVTNRFSQWTDKFMTENSDIVILQVMKLNDREIVVECVKKEDYNNLTFYKR